MKIVRSKATKNEGDTFTHKLVVTVLMANLCTAFVTQKQQLVRGDCLLLPHSTTGDRRIANSKCPGSAQRHLSMPSFTATTPRLQLTSGVSSAAVCGVGTHFLVRILVLRTLAFVYGVAFLVALHQNKALIGDNGLTPAQHPLDSAEKRGRLKRQRREEWMRNKKKYKYNSVPRSVLGALKSLKLVRSVGDALNNSTWFARMREVLSDRSDANGYPLVTLLWFAKDRQNLNRWLDGIAISGLAMASVVFLLGAANLPLLLGLWLCQRSIMAVGGPFYGYFWEPILAEMGFHALFMVPLLSLNPVPSHLPVPLVVVWAMRWFLFRIIMGAGLIKIRGDRKWKDLTAMNYFYETQPVPHPLSRYLHWAPNWWHKWEVLTNHFVELVAPWLLILPGLSRKWRIAGGIIQVLFQMALISSGNLSFLNWLTMIPAFFCFDDAFLGKLFAPHRTTSVSAAAYTQVTLNSAGASSVGLLLRKLVNVAFGGLIVTLSIPVVMNLLSRRQAMNVSFDPLRLINSYGAFGVVNENRDELIVESAHQEDGPWKQYEFKVKPGDIFRRPRWITPYHFRLDWQMWMAARFGFIQESPWMYGFLSKLLKQDEDLLGLMEKDPWKEDEGGKAPKYIRVEKYRYRFHKPDPNAKSSQPYWDRKRIGTFFPTRGVATEETLSELVTKLGTG